MSKALLRERNCVRVFPSQYATSEARNSFCHASNAWIDKIQEYDSGAGEEPCEERLATSVRQRASEIEGYTLSVIPLLDVDFEGLAIVAGDLLL
jgi:hypothetical protein